MSGLPTLENSCFPELSLFWTSQFLVSSFRTSPQGVAAWEGPALGGESLPLERWDQKAESASRAGSRPQGVEKADRKRLVCQESMPQVWVCVEGEGGSKQSCRGTPASGHRSEGNGSDIRQAPCWPAYRHHWLYFHSKPVWWILT